MTATINPALVDGEPAAHPHPRKTKNLDVTGIETRGIDAKEKTIVQATGKGNEIPVLTHRGKTGATDFDRTRDRAVAHLAETATPSPHPTNRLETRHTVRDVMIRVRTAPLDLNAVGSLLPAPHLRVLYRKTIALPPTIRIHWKT